MGFKTQVNGHDVLSSLRPQTVMDDEFSLRSNEQRRILRWTVLAFPVLLFYAIFFLFESIFNAVLPGEHINVWEMYRPVFFWCFAVPGLYGFFLAKVYSDKLQIKNGRLHYGLLGSASLDLSSLIEISGDGGTAANNYRERLLMHFADGTVFYIDSQEYEDEEIRSFLGKIKQIVPSCRFTYSEVIPLESRGLLKFLVSTAPVENMILELSKTPLIDLVVQLVKQNEKRFLATYAAISISVMALLSYGACINHRPVPGGYSYINSILQPVSVGSEITELQDEIRRSQHQVQLMKAEYAKPTQGDVGRNSVLIHDNIVEENLDIFVQEARLFGLSAIEYWQTSGGATAQILWMGLGFIILSLRLISVTTPQFLFVDSQSIGMGRRFNRFESVGSIKLKKNGEMGDPLDGTLEIQAVETLSIDLARIPDLQQRHLLLRLVDRFAGNAFRNDEFMRTTNAIVDIQFTDLWLKSSDTHSAQKKEELGSERLLHEKYRIQSVLGYGGQGTTFLAKYENESDGEHEQLVIKETVLPTQADVRVMLDTIQRMKRGANLLEKLDHPNIVRLIDDFVENDRAYLVMEYIPGETLRQLVKKQGAIDEKRVIRFAIETCEIIEYLHTRDPQVIHCDLAPDNLILTPNGKLKLVDFDVARVVDGESHTLIAGRPSYTPPEQFRGKPVAQSDIFALGAIMHFLLHGTDPPPLGSGFDELDGDALLSLDALIHRCLAFEVEERPASAAELKSQLESLLNSKASDGERIELENKEKQSATQVQNQS
jgi:hypothetical protein